MSTESANSEQRIARSGKWGGNETETGNGTAAQLSAALLTLKKAHHFQPAMATAKLSEHTGARNSSSAAEHSN